jgi:hypothetical protein
VFDFRYHAVSIIAVFLALTVGLVLGVAIGDRGLISGAEKDIRKSLRADVNDARAEAGQLRDQLAAQDRAARATYPALVGGRLEGHRVGVVFLGRSSNRVAQLVQDALAPSGARVVSTVVVREPLDVGGLAARSGGTRYTGLGSDPRLLEPFAERIGVQLVTGGRLLGQVRRSLFSASNGSLDGLDGVVVVRDPGKLQGADATTAEAFEDGLIKGINSMNVPVVGVETTTTKPSQISWYRSRSVASVDNLDQVTGRASLVFTLTGIDGAFGVGRGSDSLFPRVLTGGAPATTGG